MSSLQLTEAAGPGVQGSATLWAAWCVLMANIVLLTETEPFHVGLDGIKLKLAAHNGFLKMLADPFG